MTHADARLVASGQKLLVVFDALDRLGDTWQTVQELTRGLLKQTLKMNSYRAIRLKLFMRVDQFRIEAHIKRKGGVKPPRRTGS